MTIQPKYVSGLNKIAWRIICNFVAFFLFTNAASHADDNFVRAAEHAKRAIAQIGCMSRTNVRFFGSAFFISSKGKFVTAAHVVNAFANAPEIKDCGNAAIFSPPEKIVAGSVTVASVRFDPAKCSVDAVKDVAVCLPQSKPRFAFGALTIDGRRRPELTPIAATGFPTFRSPNPVTTTGVVAGYTQDGELLIQGSAWPGSSGSPIYDSKARVVGVLVAEGIRRMRGMVVAQSAEAVTRLLTQKRQQKSRK